MVKDVPKIKLFNRWSFDDVAVTDPSLKRYINLRPIIVPKTGGRHAKTQFHKSNLNIVERFINKLMVPGHQGKKHLLTSGRCTGKTFTIIKIVEKVFEELEKRTKTNPIQVLVRAIENAAPREEITSYQIGGIIARKAVVTSPQRRVDIALRHICQAAYRKAFGKKISMVDALVEEILGAYNNDPSKSFAIKEKERVEREAEGAR